jgi:hypothetical protein
MILILFLSIIVLSILNLKMRGKYRIRDIVSPKRWKAVLVWLLKLAVSKLDRRDTYLTKNELLQYSYRVAKCHDCLQNGSCLHCGCHAEGRLNGITDECSAGKWGAFLSDDEMNKFLENNKLIFDVKIEKKDDNI